MLFSSLLCVTQQLNVGVGVGYNLKAVNT